MNYSKRLEKLQIFLKEKNLDALLVDSPINIFYLTGMSVSLGRIIVEQKNALFFVDARYVETCKKNSPIPVTLSSDNAFLSYLSSPKYANFQTLAFDSLFTNYYNFTVLKEQILSTKNPHLTLTPIEHPLEKLRNIKDREEIYALKQAAELGSLGFDFACSLLKENISETEVSQELEIFWKRKGSDKLAFEINISFGPNSSMPHHRASTAKLKKEQVVLMDIGVTLNHYNSDMTRTVFFGTPSHEMHKIYSIVQEAQQTALDHCHPGVSLGDLDFISRSVIEKAGYGKHYSHSLGHGIGLDVHEFPTIRNTPPNKDFLLTPGMVITIEPGIYLPKIGGVRIEDTIVITENSYENLSLRPKELTIL